jgi:isopenicillin N synthase-like dioxygenase
MAIEASIPVIDLSDLRAGDTTTAASKAYKQRLAKMLHAACRDIGFFYLTGHGVDPVLQAELEDQSRRFFDMEQAAKMRIRMALGGRAWRGYFPLGAELTSGKPDLKEGIYFGQELPPDHPKVKAGIPLHGPNLFPEQAGFRATILAYIAAVTQLGHELMGLLSLSLGLPEDYFFQHYTHDPLILFRIFHYPPQPGPSAQGEDTKEHWGVGEHTDYGVLTILKQDDCGGLQIKTQDRWIEAPTIPNAFVCNIGDMLERMTGGLYKSTPHRVRNVSGRERYSYPLFFDPGFDCQVGLLPDAKMHKDDGSKRWDQASVHQFTGTYGDYILTKVARVFPELKAATLTDPSN